jgi:endonuclease-3
MFPLIRQIQTACDHSKSWRRGSLAKTHPRTPHGAEEQLATHRVLCVEVLAAAWRDLPPRRSVRPVGVDKKKLANDVRRRLVKAMPEPRCELEHRNAFELLIATILSAQSTDKMVNKVTPPLFARYPTPAALAAAEPADLEDAIRATGFFRNKSKAIRAASQRIVDEYGGTVPKTMEEITTLPGVARKTGNVVLGTAYRIATGITVDTHAGRVARRLKLTKHEDPLRVEGDLCAVFPKASWIDMGHRFVLHGRYVCLARKPRCADCPLNEVCRSAEAKPVGSWGARAAREGELVEARGAGTAPEAEDPLLGPLAQP